MASELDTYRVYKSNYLVEACYRLNLEEQRLMIACIAQIDSRPENYTDQPIIKVNATDYADIYNLNMKNAYTQLKAATDSIYERDIKIKNDATGTLTRVRWVSSVQYQKNKGCVTLSFSPEIKKYLFALTQRFTSYRLVDVASLKSSYSIRIYELLMQHKSMKKTGRLISLDDFRKMLDIENKYAMFADLKKRVLEPSVKELNKSTDLSVSYNTIKDGRKIVAIEFVTSINPQQRFSLM